MYNPTANILAYGCIAVGGIGLCALCGYKIGVAIGHVLLDRRQPYRGIGYLEDDPTLRIISEAKKEMRKEDEP